MTFPVGVSDAVLSRLLNSVGKDITGILDTTRDTVREEIERGLEAGDGAAQLGDRIEQAAAFDEYRAETIARTETATLLNRAAIESYREFGITHVTVIDGDDDEECATANGQTWTLEEAEANPIAHPNCVRDFAPIVGRVEAREEEPPATEVPLTADVAPKYELGQNGVRPEAEGRAFADLSEAEREAFREQYGSGGVPTLGPRDDAALDAFSKDFAATYQADPVEHGAILAPDGTLLYESGGLSLEEIEQANVGVDLSQRIGGQVEWGDDASGLMRGNIITHTHPGANTPLSDGDVAHAIGHGVAEIRAEARDVSYRMRPGREDGQWFDIDPEKAWQGQLNADMRRTYDSALDRISIDDERREAAGIVRRESGIGFEDADGKPVAIEEWWMSEAWADTASEFGWIYEVVPH